MITVTITEIQQDILGYLQRVEAGETIRVRRDEHVVAEIKPVASDEATDNDLINADTQQAMTFAQMAEAFQRIAKPAVPDVDLNVDPDDYPLS